MRPDTDDAANWKQERTRMKIKRKLIIGLLGGAMLGQRRSFENAVAQQVTPCSQSSYAATV